MFLMINFLCDNVCGKSKVHNWNITFGINCLNLRNQQLALKKRLGMSDIC